VVAVKTDVFVGLPGARSARGDALGFFPARTSLRNFQRTHSLYRRNEERL
jgi:hypothetical protein